MTTWTSRRRFLGRAGLAWAGLSAGPGLLRHTLAEEPAAAPQSLEYKRMGKKSLRMDLYPPSVAKDAPAPVHVFIHGGGWLYNDRTRSRLAVFRKVFELLGQAGLIGVSIDYTPPGVEGNRTIPACIENCKDAIRFVRSRASQFKADPRRIAVWGESAGGHLALMVALTGEGDFKGLESLAALPADVRCACSWYGPTDFTIKEYMTSTGNFDYQEKLLGGNYSPANMPFYRSISPYYYLKKGGPPLLLCHGDKDEMTDWNYSRVLAEKAKQVGQEAAFLSVRNARHVWEPWQGQSIQPPLEEIQARTADFILKHVGGTKAGDRQGRH